MDPAPPSARKRKTVRSYVRRSGRLTASQRRALDELWPRYGIEDASARLDFSAVFGRDAPHVLEIGFGNGETLVELAAASPECDFIGIEVHEPGLGHCLIALKRAGIDNLRLISADAMEVLERGIPAHSLARINLYFPDPWPKKRHHKRRIVKPRFLELCAAALQPGGELRIATDWADYADHIDSALGDCASFLLRERRTHAGDRPLDRPVTKFERRGRARGHRIWDWCFLRA